MMNFLMCALGCLTTSVVCWNVVYWVVTSGSGGQVLAATIATIVALITGGMLMNVAMEDR